MDLPKRPGGPQLPRKPWGGGAAARQLQFDQERGIADALPRTKPASSGEPDEPEQTPECTEQEP